MNEFLKSLHNPSKVYRGKIFWSWNGTLDYDVLKKQMNQIKKMGFGGFFMHSRTGLETEYLSDEWFEYISFCAKYAYQIGLEAWLYDEDRWPSGTAGGLVTKNPAYQIGYISLYDTYQDLPIIAEFAYKNTSDYYEVHDVSEVSVGYQHLIFHEEKMKPSNFYNGYTYLDTMNPEATDAYFKSTHEKYKTHVGHLFGKEIKGIFTDEPHRGPIFTGFNLDNDNKFNMTPYTSSLFSKHHELWQEDLKSKLPELYFTSAPNQVAYRYVETLQQLFINHYIKPYQSWCKDNHLILTGHMLHEDSLTSQASLSGSAMRFYEYMDYPGIDNLTTTDNMYWSAKQAVSVAKQLGRPFILSEMYGASGWDSSFETLKQIGDWHAFYGINLRCLHLSMYTMKGEAKRDYPMSIFHQADLVDDFHYLEDYFARFNMLMTESEDLTDLLVIHPIEKHWQNIHHNWAKWLYLEEQPAIDLESKFRETFNELSARHIDFDYADEYLLSKYGEIIIEDRQTYLKVGMKKYRSLLIDFDSIRPSTISLIDSFEQLGGKVYRKSDSVKSSSVHTITEIATTLKKYHDFYILFTMNFDRTTSFELVDIAVDLKDYIALEYDMRTNQLSKESYPAEKITTSYAHGQERVFFLMKKIDSVEKPLLDTENIVPYQIDDCYPYRLHAYNVIPLDQVTVFKAKEFFYQGDVLEADIKLRTFYQLELRGNAMLQPWFVKKHKPSLLDPKDSIELAYSFHIKDLPSSIYLAVEGDWHLTVNGLLPRKTSIFWKDQCFEVYDISTLVQRGSNSISLKTIFSMLVDLEAIYVLGKFGVDLPNTVTTLPKLLKPYDFKNQKLPYYSGKISFDLSKISSLSFALNKTLNTMFAHIKTAHHSYDLSYHPYQANVDESSIKTLELILSPRNTFGPLHEASMQLRFTEPHSFLNATKNINILD